MSESSAAQDPAAPAPGDDLPGRRGASPAVLVGETFGVLLPPLGFLLLAMMLAL
ncbi:hypothetical protein [Streptomyces sp. NBC_01579]|uniref:hypothetical protein n=1 Tax=unclassified Streptomyces TaxID=2593676 RepID=UPI00386EB6C0|nr:hypothetical protein OG955_05565 [Streptomyces sp. NBC_01602]